MTSEASHYRKPFSVMNQLRDTYSSVDITAISIADNIKLRICLFLSKSHKNAELVKCVFKQFFCFMAWILYEIVPSAYCCWAVWVPPDRLKGNGVEMTTGTTDVKIYLQISTGFYD